MIIGDLKKIKARSNSNKNIMVIVSEVTYDDINNLGHVFGWQQKHIVITGDCLELDYKSCPDAYYFNIYIKQGSGYMLDKSQSLYIDFSINPTGDIEYGIEVTEADYKNLRWQIKTEERKRKILKALTSFDSCSGSI